MSEKTVAEEQNDNQQQHGEDDHAHAGNTALRPEGEERKRTVQHAQPLLTDGHDESRQNGAGNRAHAAHDDDH